MEKRWRVKEVEDKDVVADLSTALGISSTLSQLLVQRDVKSYEQARAFFRPSLDALHDPMQMKDMDKAVERIIRALESGEQIMVYGDYDVDGTTSVALLYSYLQPHHPKISTYIPDRYKEGYGVSKSGIDEAHQRGVTLIICLDCGIKAHQQVAYARSLGIDFIICDHHLPADELPDACAVLDPKRGDCPYPYKELSGCGIGFKLAQALTQALKTDPRVTEELLDLVAVSIASDIVPITGENRILCAFGLKKVNESPRIGIKALKDINQLTKPLNVRDLVFVIGPRINAAGRIEHGKTAVDLLTCDREEQALEIAQKIDDHNRFRKDLDREITAEALKMIEQDPAYASRKTTVLYSESWHKGVIGIVASRVMESHYRPTILLTESNGMATGSARSVRGFDIHRAIEACADLLVNFGGHKYAAGLTLETKNIPAFQERFEAIVATSISEEQLVAEITVDAEIDFDEITPKFYRILKQFAPFGPGNLSPTFVTKGVVDDGGSRAVGADQTHLKLQVRQTQKDNTMKGIAFGFGHHHTELAGGQTVDLAYHLEENNWNGKTSVELMVKDLKTIR